MKLLVSSTYTLATPTKSSTLSTNLRRHCSSALKSGSKPSRPQKRLLRISHSPPRKKLFLALVKLKFYFSNFVEHLQVGLYTNIIPHRPGSSERNPYPQPSTSTIPVQEGTAPIAIPVLTWGPFFMAQRDVLMLSHRHRSE